MDYTQLRRSINRSGERFLNRVFTAAERKTCEGRRDPVPCYCSRFAAKEAFAKAMRIGIFKAGLKNIEVKNRPDGSPYLYIHPPLQRRIAGFERLDVQLSLSDGLTHAAAFVVVCRRPGDDLA